MIKGTISVKKYPFPITIYNTEDGWYAKSVESTTEFPVVRGDTEDQALEAFRVKLYEKIEGLELEDEEVMSSSNEAARDVLRKYFTYKKAEETSEELLQKAISNLTPAFHTDLPPLSTSEEADLPEKWVSMKIMKNVFPVIAMMIVNALVFFVFSAILILDYYEFIDSNSTIIRAIKSIVLIFYSGTMLGTGAYYGIEVFKGNEDE